MRENPIVSEIIRSSLTFCSEEMGIALRNSAYSPNIKDRMDHSCAIMDPHGRLLAQAEHIPVHLGSLPWGLKKTLEYVEREGMELFSGDMVMVNNPYLSGTHLNDITLISPVFSKGRIVAYAANKAHHSDVGGKVPGSIPPDATDLFQEGMIIDPVKLVNRGRINGDVLSLLSSNSRDPYQRKGDARAQIAANILGEKRIMSMVSEYGIRSFESASETALDYSERMTRLAIGSFPGAAGEASDCMEVPGMDDIPMHVSVTRHNDTIAIDYTGTSKQVRAPINAVYGVTLSAVYYVLKCITDPDIMMNDGCFRPITVNVPQGTLLNPTFPYPVSAGNTETSMRNADLLLRAFYGLVPDRIPAACGGSMNNIMIGGICGGRTWSFYETNAVGMGASSGMDGADGIHCNMTNTLNTPAELVELYYPLSIVRYQFRDGSGGPGKWRGGAGIERSYRVKSDDTLFTVMAEREWHSPPGLKGGGEGSRTEVYAEHDGQVKRIPTKCSIDLASGDVVTIKTAGGGGYGPYEDRAPELLERDSRDRLIRRP